MPTVSEGGLLGVVSRQKLCMSHTRATLRIGQVSKSKMGFGTGLSVDAMSSRRFACGRKSVNQQSAPAKSHNANHRTPDEPSGTNNDDNPTGNSSHGAQVNFVRLLPCWTLVLFVKLVVVPSGKRSSPSSFMGVELDASVDERKTSEDQQPSESESSSHDKR
ncbi:hypothetical protein IV203_033007 [Nitzschia inconspicua]|uniref:Uncharacterized protein n=1 Tax=Nitzschia inconspicua TaxID=303405 RepID=A0A9K3PG31_9STRA|nr:hypothetical protein IV203_033007 [Nitzschia inconspicua]